MVHFARLKYFISIIYFLFPHQKCESFLKPAIPAAFSFQCNTNLQFISTSKRDDDWLWSKSYVICTLHPSTIIILSSLIWIYSSYSRKVDVVLKMQENVTHKDSFCYFICPFLYFLTWNFNTLHYAFVLLKCNSLYSDCSTALTIVAISFLFFRS